MRARLLTIQFWSGLALAPLAALLLLFGAATAAAALAIIAVVVLGMVVVMRRDDSAKLDIEETLLDEIDMLRDDVRSDITTAARATHKALADRVASLQDSLSAVQRQVEAARAQEAARAAETARAIEAARAEMARAETDRAHGADVQVAPPGALPRRPANGASAPGVVRRTETVQVTTRTIVDPYAAPVGRDGYPQAGRPYDAPDDHGRAPVRPGWSEPDEPRYGDPHDDYDHGPRAGRPEAGGWGGRAIGSDRAAPALGWSGADRAGRDARPADRDGAAGPAGRSGPAAGRDERDPRPPWAGGREDRSADHDARSARPADRARSRDAQPAGRDGDTRAAGRDGDARATGRDGRDGYDGRAGRDDRDARASWVTDRDGRPGGAADRDGPPPERATRPGWTGGRDERSTDRDSRSGRDGWPADRDARPGRADDHSADRDGGGRGGDGGRSGWSAGGNGRTTGDRHDAWAVPDRAAGHDSWGSDRGAAGHGSWNGSDRGVGSHDSRNGSDRGDPAHDAWGGAGRGEASYDSWTGSDHGAANPGSGTGADRGAGHDAWDGSDRGAGHDDWGGSGRGAGHDDWGSDRPVAGRESRSGTDRGSRDAPARSADRDTAGRPGQDSWFDRGSPDDRDGGAEREPRGQVQWLDPRAGRDQGSQPTSRAGDGHRRPDGDRDHASNGWSDARSGDSWFDTGPDHDRDGWLDPRSGRREDKGYDERDGERRDSWSERGLPAGRDASDGARPPGHSRALAVPDAGDSREESWAEAKLREYLARRDDPYADSGDLSPARVAAADDGRWSAVRAGDRWAEVRTDERGRELRMGERRAERRVDETGTQLRIVDRWSSVREEPARPGPDAGWSPAVPEDGAWTNGESRSERRRREDAEEQAARMAARETWSPPDDGHGAGRSPVVPAPREPADDRYDPHGARDSYGARPDPRAARPASRPEPPRLDQRDDRWVREPGARVGSRPRPVDFDNTDERWR